MSHVERPIGVFPRRVERPTIALEGPVFSRVVCPTCSMEASRHDLRLLVPVADGERETRKCRNCGDVFSLADASDEALALAQG